MPRTGLRQPLSDRHKEGSGAARRLHDHRSPQVLSCPVASEVQNQVDHPAAREHLTSRSIWIDGPTRHRPSSLHQLRLTVPGHRAPVSLKLHKCHFMSGTLKCDRDALLHVAIDRVEPPRIAGNLAVFGAAALVWAVLRLGGGVRLGAAVCGIGGCCARVQPRFGGGRGELPIPAAIFIVVSLGLLAWAAWRVLAEAGQPDGGDVEPRRSLHRPRASVPRADHRRPQRPDAGLVPVVIGPSDSGVR